MNTDETRDMLARQMGRALQRVIDALDLIDDLPEDGDQVEVMDSSHLDYLEDLGVDTAADQWSPSYARACIREDLDDVLSVTWEKGEPFDVALTLGGPNIYLVDFGGHGGAQLVGHWSTKHVMTGPDVSRAVDYYRELFAELYGE